MKHSIKIIAVIMLLFAVGYNLWLYRYEPTAKVDPNDNPFQYALVLRTYEMWDFAAKECPKNILYPICFIGYLIDHNVPNWAQGYSLPFYYSHASQISIVASYRLFDSLGLIHPINSLFFKNSQEFYASQSYMTPLFTYYHVVIYLLLCLFPVSVFFAFRAIKAPWLVAGFGALIASHISTDGLYGLDPTSFLWRGYGLSSQLSSMFFMPLAIAWALRFFQAERKANIHIARKLPAVRWLLSFLSVPSFLPALVFLTLAVMGHLGLGLITLISIGILAVSPAAYALLEKKHRSEIIQLGMDQISKLLFLAGSAVALLSYWILPVLMASDYNNISFWDPVWKFNSWGWKEVVTQFLNGNLFDFGRFPTLSLLLTAGCFAVFFLFNKGKNADVSEEKTKKNISLIPFSFLFVFWFVFFFGRATWGGLIDLIPAMKEFHQSRFIVGVHLAGFFVIPIGFWWTSLVLKSLIITFIAFIKRTLDLLQDQETTEQEQSTSFVLPEVVVQNGVFIVLAFLVVLAVYQRTWAYANHNDVLIKQGNANFDRQNPDVETLISLLKNEQPGRVFTGRGGQWGKDLLIAETTYYMHLSTYGIPVILWLPETWSPNSDVEQFFVEDWKEHYDLMNIRYVVAPPKIEPKPFWNKIAETPSWVLYTVPTSGYFTTGSHAAVVYADKTHYVNVVRLWMQSDYVKQQIFPELTFDYSHSVKHTLPNFQMVDEASYAIRGGDDKSLFGDSPKYEGPKPNVEIVGPEQVISDMIYKTTIKVQEPCVQCLAIVKVTDHPSWQAYLNGKRVDHVTVFPFYIGVPVSTPGEYTLELRYQPSPLKLLLLVVGIILCGSVVFIHINLYIGQKHMKKR